MQTPAEPYISFKAHKDKARNCMRDQLLEDIVRWEQLDKKQVSSERTGQLREAYGNLKIIVVHNIARDVMYAR